MIDALITWTCTWVSLASEVIGALALFAVVWASACALVPCALELLFVVVDDYLHGERVKR